MASMIVFTSNYHVTHGLVNEIVFSTNTQHGYGQIRIFFKSHSIPKKIYLNVSFSLKKCFLTITF